MNPLQRLQEAFKNKPRKPINLHTRGCNRNKPCPCGSGVKAKKCCWNK